MSNSFCDNVCCGGAVVPAIISPSVAPYNPPAHNNEAEIRDSPPPPPRQRQPPSPRLEGYSGPVMEIAEDSETIDSKDKVIFEFGTPTKKSYVRSKKFPGGLSVELPSDQLVSSV